MNEIKFIINPNKKENYIRADFSHKEEPVSKHIDKNPIGITQLELSLAVRIFLKDAVYYKSLIEDNKNKKIIVNISFEK